MNGSRPGRKPVRVRRARIDDLDAIVLLRLALLREDDANPRFAHPQAARRVLRLTRSQLATPGQVFLVATRGAGVVGILRCRAVRRTPLVAVQRQAVVTTAYVVPHERRRGVLRALVRAADRWCRHEGLRAMRLQCALGNEAARKAWHALGFHEAEVLSLRAVPAA